jgi:hypothetical protein
MLQSTVQQTLLWKQLFSADLLQWLAKAQHITSVAAAAAGLLRTNKQQPS